MKTSSIIMYILAAFAIIFSFLFILGGTDATGDPSWIIIGLVGLLIGFALIYAGVKIAEKARKAADNVYNIKLDLPGNVKIDQMKCQACGAPLNPNDLSMVNGAPVVTCHSCGTTYQLTEEPKW